MKNRFVLAGIIAIIAVVAGYLAWTYANHLDYLSKTRHETERWAVIRDSKGDIIAVETTNDEVWNTLGGLHKSQTAMWIGGIIEKYDNKWGFRFRPDTIVVRQNITVEDARSKIQSISGDYLDYWISVWTRETYVFAEVLEIHE